MNSLKEAFEYDERFNRFKPKPEFKDALQRFMVGDSITDREIDILIDYFKTFEAFLKAVGPHYHLPWIQAHSDLQRLESFKRAREEGK